MQSLSHIDLFRALTEDELQELSRSAQPVRVGDKTTLIVEGEAGDTLYCILSGKVKVALSDSEGREIVLTYLGEGEFFGEMTLFDNRPRSASITTCEESEFFAIQKDQFREFLGTHPGIMLHLIESLVARLRATDSKVENLAFLDAAGRIAHTLVELAEQDGRYTKGGDIIVPRLTQQEISELANTSREMVSRVFSDFGRRGIITVADKHIVIHKKLGALGQG
ncbi:MAG: hypothetical protein AUJ55_07685 [Proteobacteria bacterium CG1_02_64_396]|nr:MAG: hypothetical protein AUJ55_07685 [Proteobacteria bacterium CG1_02_64_396]